MGVIFLLMVYSSRDILVNNLKLEGLNTCFQNLEGKTTRVLKFMKQNKLCH